MGFNTSHCGFERRHWLRLLRISLKAPAKIFTSWRCARDKVDSWTASLFSKMKTLNWSVQDTMNVLIAKLQVRLKQRRFQQDEPSRSPVNPSIVDSSANEDGRLAAMSMQWNAIWWHYCQSENWPFRWFNVHTSQNPSKKFEMVTTKDRWPSSESFVSSANLTWSIRSIQMRLFSWHGSRGEMDTIHKENFWMDEWKEFDHGEMVLCTLRKWTRFVFEFSLVTQDLRSDNNSDIPWFTQKGRILFRCTKKSPQWFVQWRRDFGGMN